MTACSVLRTVPPIANAGPATVSSSWPLHSPRSYHCLWRPRKSIKLCQLIKYNSLLVFAPRTTTRHKYEVKNKRSVAAGPPYPPGPCQWPPLSPARRHWLRWPGYFFPADCVVGEVNENIHLRKERVISEFNCTRVVVVGQNVTYLRTPSVIINAVTDFQDHAPIAIFKVRFVVWYSS